MKNIEKKALYIRDLISYEYIKGWIGLRGINEQYRPSLKTLSYEQ